MITKTAEITWLTKNEGGRSKPPLGLGEPPYATVIHFVGDAWPHIRGSWSLVVQKVESLSSEFHWVANINYLMDNAPHDSLQEGREFELYEGNKCVARGRITES